MSELSALAVPPGGAKLLHACAKPGANIACITEIAAEHGIHFITE